MENINSNNSNEITNYINRISNVEDLKTTINKALQKINELEEIISKIDGILYRQFNLDQKVLETEKNKAVIEFIKVFSNECYIPDKIINVLSEKLSIINDDIDKQISLYSSLVEPTTRKTN